MRLQKRKAASASVVFGPATDMSRLVRLAAAAALGGLLTVIAVVSSMRPPSPPRTTQIIAGDTPAANPNAAELRRCRAITTADTDCDAAWEIERQRFFHGRERQP